MPRITLWRVLDDIYAIIRVFCMYSCMCTLCRPVCILLADSVLSVITIIIILLPPKMVKKDEYNTKCNTYFRLMAWFSKCKIAYVTRVCQWFLASSICRYSRMVVRRKWLIDFSSSSVVSGYVATISCISLKSSSTACQQIVTHYYNVLFFVAFVVF